MKKEVYPRYLSTNKKYLRSSGFQKLRSAMDSLPGIETFCSSSNAKNGINIWFKVKNSKQGLFFLTRCVDSRYWKYGNIWKIELNVGDMNDGQLPIHYHLHSGSVVGGEAYRQAESLIDNMNYHLNHKNFIKGFDIDIDKFKWNDVVMMNREKKLEKLKRKLK